MLRRSILVLMLLLLAVNLSALAQPDAPDPSITGPTLERILARGQLICAVNEDVFGFGFLNPNTGEITGLNIDLCGAVAAAIFGDARAVDLRLMRRGAPLDETLAPDVDVVMAHALPLSYTVGTAPGVAFGPPTFYDGPALMVRADSGITGWEFIEGDTICTLSGGIQTALMAALTRAEVAHELLIFDEPAAMNQAFLAGRCTIQALDRSLLEILRANSPAPATYTVWEQPFARADLRPIYHADDKQWGDIIHWTIWGLIRAEELNVTQGNVGGLAQRGGEDAGLYTERVGAEIAALLSAGDDALGLPDGFMARVIGAVGNYGEIYDRYFGPQSVVTIPRSVNALWSAGGLHTSPPWR